ncbi:CPBP family intramembrane metalloprotease [Candidatus Micrarchaeota archaeon]|nr:CPBP family intramembrane metalloprotease [Candidatus Micrarchaeota archaeon]
MKLMKNHFLFLFVLSAILFPILFFIIKDPSLYQIPIHSAIFSLGMFLVWKSDFQSTLSDLGFPGSIMNTIKYVLLGLVLLFLLMIATGLIAYFFGITDQTKVQDKIRSFSPLVIALAVFFAPLSEEILFRGYLSRKIGIIPSSIVFGLLHFGYGSVIEVLGATLIGILLAWLFQKSKSLTPPLLLHVLYNLFSVVFIRVLS